MVVAIGAVGLLVAGGAVAAAIVLPRILPAASPEAAAERLLTSIATLDYLALGSTIAPSESALFLEPLQELRSVALEGEQGSGTSAGDAIGRLQQAASIEISDLVFERDDLATGVALVTLTEGIITIDGDRNEIAGALAEFTTLTRQAYWASAELSDQEIADEIDRERELIAENLEIPFIIDIEEIVNDSGLESSLYSVVTVDEGGWYVSPLMTYAQSVFAPIEAYGGEPLRYGDDIVEASVSATPEDAMQATFDAVTDVDAGRDYFRDIAATLPLPERRLLSVYGPVYAELSGYENPWQAGMSEDVGVSTSGEFRGSEVAGSVAEVTSWLLQFELTGNDRYTNILIDDHCLDFSWYSEYYDYYWEEWTTSSDSGSYCLDDPGLGLDYSALGIDEPSLVAIRTDGGWQFSLVATTARIATDAARGLAELSRTDDLDQIFARSAVTMREAL